MTFDYTSMGFYTFDALCRPVNDLPPGGNTYFIEDFTLAVSGAAGSASIVAAKHGLNVQAVGGVGNDLMGDWVLRRLADFDVDAENMQRCEDFSTSSSIVTTRPDGARPAFHKLGATGGFFVTDEQIDRVLDTKIFHIGGVGLMDKMDHRKAENDSWRYRPLNVGDRFSLKAAVPSCPSSEKAETADAKPWIAWPGSSSAA